MFTKADNLINPIKYFWFILEWPKESVVKKYKKTDQPGCNIHNKVNNVDFWMRSFLKAIGTLIEEDGKIHLLGPRAESARAVTGT